MSKESWFDSWQEQRLNTFFKSFGQLLVDTGLSVPGGKAAEA
jgi:hypothetical protein